jgi:hypothetical protein
MADNIQDPNEERDQNPENPRPEGTTGRDETMPRRDEDVPGEQRERDVTQRPDERRDESEFGGDTEAEG